MSGKAQQQKRKADAPAAAPQQKKAKDAAPAAPAQPAKKAPQQQQAQAAGKKGGKGAAPAPKEKAPEPEEEEEAGEEDGDDDEPKADEEALQLIETVQEPMDLIAGELEAYDQQMQAEIYAIQKKYLLKKRPILARRDELLTKLPSLWKTLMTEHHTFAAQFEEVDHEIVDALSVVEVEEQYSDSTAEKQQIVGLHVLFTFRAGNKHVKAGKFKKAFQFDDEKEALMCVSTPAKEQPFVNQSAFAAANKDSFFLNWFASEGEDEGIISAQDALTSELYVDPLQLYTVVCSGGDLNNNGQDDDEEAMSFEEGEDDDEEGDAPELVDQ